MRLNTEVCYQLAVWDIHIVDSVTQSLHSSVSIGILSGLTPAQLNFLHFLHELLLQRIEDLVCNLELSTFTEPHSPPGIDIDDIEVTRER